MKNLSPNRYKSMIEMKVICVILILISLMELASSNYVIRPTVFSITSQGADAGEYHQIKFQLSYVSNGQGLKSMSFPANGYWVSSQCPNGGNQYFSYCDFKHGTATPIPNAGWLQIKSNDSYNSIHLNIDEIDDSFTYNQSYTVSISSSDWKMSSNQCTPYEIRMVASIQSQIKHTNCFSVGLGLEASAGIEASAFSGLVELANAKVKADFSIGWKKCSQWIEPQKTYVLYASVINTAPYPNVTHNVAACSSSMIAITDGYQNPIYPYNVDSLKLPSWIKWNKRGYYAEPSPLHVGSYSFSLNVFGVCGAKNLTTLVNVLPEAKYSAHNFTVDACAAAYLPVFDNYGNTAVPTSFPAASVNWIISDNQSHIATPTLAQQGSHNVLLNLKSSCGARNVTATIKVNPEQAYPNINATMYSCSTLRLKVKNIFGIPVPPSSEDAAEQWISKDSEDYIARPSLSDVGIHKVNLSMFSYCGPRYITATLTVTQSEDFLVDKKIIIVKNYENTSYHSLKYAPEHKELTFQNLTSQNSDKDYDWISMNSKGNITLTPLGLSPGVYKFFGICSDKCARFKKFALEVHISTTSHGKLLSFVGLATVAVLLAIVF